MSSLRVHRSFPSALFGFRRRRGREEKRNDNAPTTRQIRRQQKPNLALPELLQTRQPLFLRQISMQLVAPLQPLPVKREEDLHPVRLRLGTEEDDGAAGREGTGAEGDEEGFAVAFAGTRVELDRLAGFVTTHSEDCKMWKHQRRTILSPRAKGRKERRGQRTFLLQTLCSRSHLINLDPRRLTHTQPRKRRDRLGNGSGEEERLAGTGSGGDNFFEFVAETLYGGRKKG
jgi:hypothetical protein